MKKTTITFLFCVITLCSAAQYKRASNWLFGYKAHVNFSGGSPVTSTLSQMESIEGCASISDVQGNLLFYTNSVKVWNKSHTLMSNGSGLNGDQSAAQAAIIVPLPGSANSYYLFTTDGGQYGVCYSIVDMALNGGLGDVTAGSKNIPLLSNCTEMLASTMHCNATDYWVMIQKIQAGTILFYSYLLNSTGLNVPVISTFNINNPSWNIVGNITFSQNGNLMVHNSLDRSIFLFNFDKQNGSFSFRDSIPRKNFESVYSNALSPTGNKLYTTSWSPNGPYGVLSQYDLLATNIRASRINIDSVPYIGGSPNAYGYLGEIRLAPDQKIYMSRWDQKPPFYTVNAGTYYSLDSLDAVQFPDQPAALCGFQRNHIWLKRQPTQLGLPTFVSNFTYSVAPQNSCDNTGLENALNVEHFNIFPNPSNGKINISRNSRTNCSLTLCNSEGVRLKELILPHETNVSTLELDLKPGLYFVIVTDENQVKTCRTLIIKEN